jgi:hypothetical protein
MGSAMPMALENQQLTGGIQSKIAEISNESAVCHLKFEIV